MCMLPLWPGIGDKPLPKSSFVGIFHHHCHRSEGPLVTGSLPKASSIKSSTILGSLPLPLSPKMLKPQSRRCTTIIAQSTRPIYICHVCCLVVDHDRDQTQTHDRVRDRSCSKTDWLTVHQPQSGTHQEKNKLAFAAWSGSIFILP